MILIDNKFNSINDEQKNELDEILNEVVNYLNNVITDENIKQIINENSQNIIIQLTDNYNYSIKLPNGMVRTMDFPGSVGALKTNMYNELNSSEIHIVPGVALRSNYSKHQLVHELLHALSSNEHNYFNENGITYTKTGTKIDFYDRNTDDVKITNNPSSDGLNEGITEFLASNITNDFNGNYAPFVVISKLLLDANPNLINAYFSRELDEIDKFYCDLEEKQSIITRADLMSFTSKETNIESLFKVISGALSYNKTINPNYNEEYLNDIITYLDSNYILDAGSWGDFISISNSTKM